MTASASMTLIDVINAPWNKELTLSEAEYDNGFKMLHVRIKEGKRFTDLELDPVTAAAVAQLIQHWAMENAPDDEEE